MVDNNSKPAIPAWQRAQRPQAEEKPSEQKQDDAQVEEDVPKAPEWEDAHPTEEAKKAIEEDTTTPDSNATTRLETPSLSPGDFETFKQQQTQPTTQTPAQQKPTAPPIITYPEFLMEAHKPPPLVTISRLWNTAYIASGVAALVYGASKYLVNPMSDQLNEARHEFATHSQSKIDEMNERLEKVVIKVPKAYRDATGESEVDGGETSSETSDPTELYHRDMGTQTSPPPSPSGNAQAIGAEPPKRKDPIEYQSNGLWILKSHLEEMQQRTEALEAPNKDRQDKLDDLRHYLDTLMFASPGISHWSATGAEEAGKKADGEAEGGDVVEELKREIRGVKGMMLSAKRFPGVAGRAAAAGNGT